MSENKQQDLADKFVGFIFKNKVSAIITFFVWSVIYKIVDLNTLQWFGKDMFIKSDMEPWGNLAAFIVCSAFSFSVVFLVVVHIYGFFTGKKY